MPTETEIDNLQSAIVKHHFILFCFVDNAKQRGGKLTTTFSLPFVLSCRELPGLILHSYPTLICLYTPSFLCSTLYPCLYHVILLLICYSQISVDLCHRSLKCSSCNISHLIWFKRVEKMCCVFKKKKRRHTYTDSCIIFTDCYCSNYLPWICSEACLSLSYS